MRGHREMRLCKGNQKPVSKIWSYRYSYKELNVFTAILIVLLFLLFQFTTVNADNSKKVATTGSVKGIVRKSVDNGKNWKPVEVLTEFSVGDQLLVKNKSKVKVIFYKPSHREVLTGPCKVKITSKKFVLKKGKPGCIKIFPRYRGIKALQSIKASCENFSGVEIRNDPSVVNLLYPWSKITKQKPCFKWMSTPQATEYYVKLEDLDGKIIWEESTIKTKLSYPKTASPLEFGKTYFWDIRAVKDKMVVARGSASFKLISKEVYENLEILKEQTDKEIKANPNDTTPYIVLLSFFMQNGLLDESYEYCSKLVNSGIKDKNIDMLMSRLRELKGMSIK